MTCPHCNFWQLNQETETNESETVALLCEECNRPFVYSWRIVEKTTTLAESDHQLTEDEKDMIAWSTKLSGQS